METLLNNAMAPDEVTIIGGLSAVGKADQYCKLVVTLLPTAPEMVRFHTSAAAAAIAMSPVLSPEPFLRMVRSRCQFTTF